MSLVDVISIDKDISLAKTMHSSFYLDEKYFHRTLNNIFKHSWQYLSHKDMIDSKVTPIYFLEDSIAEPLIISLAPSKDTELRSFCFAKAISRH